MAFFENLGNGIKNVGSSIKNGAEDITRKTQLNAEIGRIRKDIDTFYTQLGEITYKNLTAGEGEKADPQPVIDNLNGAFAAIRDKEDEIARIEAETQARKEEEEARKRKEEEEKAAAQAAAQASAQTAGGVCHVCGAVLLPDSKFCVQCGSPVQKPEPVPVPQPVPAERKCPNCGAHAEEEARFCVECGTKLD